MFKKISPLIVLTLISLGSAAQRNTIPCAIGDNGIILNQRSIIKKSETQFTITAIEDTVNLADAQSLFKLVVLKTFGDNIEIEKVASFSLTIIDQKGDSTILNCNDDKFSEEIVSQLKGLKINSRLIFEGIKYVNRENPMQNIRTGMLMFYIL